jgi:hypothetical protein
LTKKMGVKRRQQQTLEYILLGWQPERAVHRRLVPRERRHDLPSLSQHRHEPRATESDRIPRKLKSGRAKGTDRRGEKGDGVLGAEGDEATGAPRDVVHNAVASGADEYPLRLRFPASSGEIPGRRRHRDQSKL